MSDLRSWFVTVRLDPTRTRDEIVQARSQWSAGWLYRVLNPQTDVICVRSALRADTNETI